MSHIEYEIALDLGHTCPNEAFAWLSQLPDCAYVRTTQLLNIYFDTPNHDLKRAKAALRLRYDTQANCWLQTLKTAGREHNGMSARQEWEVVLPASETDVPAWQLELFSPDAQAYLAPIAPAMRPLFHTDFKRDIFDYRQGDNHYEWAIDRGEIRSAHEEHPARISIQDLEIELKQGNVDSMRALAERARTALNAQPQYLSKAARGYALFSNAPK
ncbi:MAG: CYTH domain-containing protein [Burkholderiales bacterium]|nr:CYTH domain-containing protein [Burkholderiales bacterium]MCE1176691.1 CYTH domain-containing protein [Burkholderiales bacterium]